ncbi:MAG: DUF732 domain-containing protein [Micromonosporaceae bacterium]
MTLRVLALITALFVVAGCGGDGNASASPPSPPRSSAPAPAAADNEPYIAALRKIDPALAEDPESAVRDASNVCLDIDQGKPAGTVVKNAALRFDVPAGQAKLIVKAARQYIC